MSSIVYRDGIMVADTRAWYHHGMPIGDKQKVRGYGNGCLAGVSSADPGMSERVLTWLEWVFDREPNIVNVNWEEQPRLDGKVDFAMLVVAPDGDGYMFYDSLFPSGPLSASYFAIGSGAYYAIGALESGLGAVEAIRIAVRCDTCSGNHLSALKHDGHSWLPPLAP